MARPAVSFVQLTKDNYERALVLCVAPDQEPFVGTVAEAMADAHFHPTYEMRAIATPADEFVGFMMWDEAEKESGIFTLNRLLIDCHHQRKGFARAALSMWIGGFRTGNKLKLSTAANNRDAIALYSGLGFVMTHKPGDSTKLVGIKIL